MEDLTIHQKSLKSVNMSALFVNCITEGKRWFVFNSRLKNNRLSGCSKQYGIRLCGTLVALFRLLS